MKFEIQPLLSVNEKGEIYGPMSPVLFAQKMGKEIGFKVHDLFRVRFKNEEMNQRKEGEYFTGYDSLVLVEKYPNNKSQLMFFVDEGGSGCPVGMMFSNEDDVIITPVYRKKNYVQKLNEVDLKKVFNEVKVNLVPPF